ncbi:hypothetical protein [Streptomyces sp. NBC_01483]|nr:hypothetical protein [Streptomyces sp. NBC_01483]
MTLTVGDDDTCAPLSNALLVEFWGAEEMRRVGVTECRRKVIEFRRFPA